jgi:AcrR family transcriptional regulator
LPRTVNTEARAVRADAFVDAAQRLIQTKGYERMSIQDVLDATGASRGALYHYFDSKEALLEAVIARITDDALAAAAPLVDDPKLPATEKLRRVFADIGRWKTERSELMRAILESWLSDGNAVVREKFRRGLVGKLGPVLERIVAQGKAEGAFRVDDPAAVARVLVSLLAAANETATELFVARHAGTVSYEQVESTLLGYFTAFERVLDIPAGSLAVVDRSLLRQWYGSHKEEGA